jgi:hypothetical protein
MKKCIQNLYVEDVVDGNYSENSGIDERIILILVMSKYVFRM